MLCYLCVLSLGCSHLVVSTSASDWPERLVSEMTYNVLMGTLNPTHSLTHSLSHSVIHSSWCFCCDVQFEKAVDVTSRHAVNQLIRDNSVDFLSYMAWDQVWFCFLLREYRTLPYLTLPSGTGVLPPSAEASIGPSAHPCINPKFTETLCTLQVFANLRIVLQCSCLRPLDPGKYNSKNFRESLSKGRGDVKPWVWLGLSSLWLIGVALPQYPGSTTT